jgi:hypothetical protein
MLARIRQIGAFWLCLRQRWSSRRIRIPSPDPISSINPDEFARLLRSGRKEDLKILARKLSERRRSRV